MSKNIGQQIIDFVRGKFIDENYISIVYNKQMDFIRNSDKIVNFVIGISYGYYGIDPNEFKDFTFNFCTPSQDLYSSYFLVKNNIDKMVHLQNIILIYPYYLSGFDLSKSSEKFKCYVHQYFLEIPLMKQNLITKLGCYLSLKRFLKKYNKNDASIFRGYNPLKSFFIENSAIDMRVKRHYKNYLKYYNSQFKWLYKLQQLSKEKNKNLILVVPPFREDYIKCLEQISSKQLIDLYEDISAFSEENNLNLINTYDFVNDFRLFGDMDHLNADGAKKLSQFVNMKIKQ